MPFSLRRLPSALAVLALVAVAACATKPKYPVGPAAHPPAESYGAPHAAPESGAIQSQGETPLPGSERDFVINAGDRVYFDLDQSTIRADAGPVLEAQAAWLSRYPNVTVRIEGNADERGTREYNFALGARRAQTVRDFLVEHGVAPSRIAVISYGKERPIDPGDNEAAWAHNRNAHTAITGGAR